MYGNIYLIHKISDESQQSGLWNNSNLFLIFAITLFVAHLASEPCLKIQVLHTDVSKNPYIVTPRTSAANKTVWCLFVMLTIGIGV